MRFDLDLPAWKWPFYIMRHPFEGYEDLRWKKAYNMPSALIIVALFFIVAVFDVLTTGFLHNSKAVKIFNVVPVIIRTVILFFTWVVANWSLCTLFNGEGKMKAICVNTAYALCPYIIGKVINIILSNMLTRDESAFLTFVSIITTTWTVVLLFSGMKTVHQYTFWQTLWSIVFTLVAMVIIIILAVLLVSLFQQVYLFVNALYTEILYRNPNLTSLALILIFIGVLAVLVTIICVAYSLFEKAQRKKEQKKFRKG